MRYVLICAGILFGLWASLQAYVLLAGYYLPLEKVAGSYLRVRLRKLGIAEMLPGGFISEVAGAYAAAAAEASRISNRGRAWTLPAMNRAMDAGVACIDAWVRRGEKIPSAGTDDNEDAEEPLVLEPAFLSEVLPRHRVPRGSVR